MGLGIIGAKQLMDQCEIQSVRGQGTTVWLKKVLPRRASLLTLDRLQPITQMLAADKPQSLLDEVRQQNQELLQTLAQLREWQEELTRLNQELEDTNRGVVALYAELDEKADHLRRADEMKSRFLSNMSHEFRTPLNSVLALTRLLLDRTDGELTAEQEKQVSFVRKAAEGLLELVNDLLDLAKIEAGKIEVRPIEFAVEDLFSALRGMLRPLLVSSTVNLVFEESVRIPPLFTDENKVSQILRNFLSNALKFTEQGEVRVSAQLTADGCAVIFSVADTGIGISASDQVRIFEEFTQVHNPLQHRVKGTGLGLPLCRRLARLLGGEVAVQSEPGVGSTFSATIPTHYEPPLAEAQATSKDWELDPDRVPVLMVEDEPETQLLYEKFLRGSLFQPIPARNLREARQALQRVQPKAIILDILLRGEDAWQWLTELKGSSATRSIPILVVTTVEDERKGRALGAEAYLVKPIDRERLLVELTHLTHPTRAPTFLIIDNDESARYVLKRLLGETQAVICEAADGVEGLALARELCPRLIFLDLKMPKLAGEAVLAQLKTDPLTSAPSPSSSSPPLSLRKRSGSAWLSTPTHFCPNRISHARRLNR
jgi:signal transduction histidine kinase/CheY-like chemotaxis protein